jgi:hypothetical protein
VLCLSADDVRKGALALRPLARTAPQHELKGSTSVRVLVSCR